MGSALTMREFLPLPSTHTVTRFEGGSFHTETRPLAPPAEDEILLRLGAAALTRDDLTGPLGTPVGEVAAVGDRVRGWEALDRGLVLWDLLPAGMEPPRELPEYLRLTPALLRCPAVRKIPLEMPSEDAVLAGALARAFRAWREAGVSPEGTLVVLGLDLVPLLTVLLARHHRAGTVIAADHSPTRRRRAEWSRATRCIRLPEEPLFETVLGLTGGAGAGAAVLGSAAPADFQEAAHSLGHGGRLVLTGDRTDGEPSHLAADLIRNRELQVFGVRRADRKAADAAFGGLRQGLAGADTIVSKRLPWNELQTLSPDVWDEGTAVLVETGEPDPPVVI